MAAPVAPLSALPPRAGLSARRPRGLAPASCFRRPASLLAVRLVPWVLFAAVMDSAAVAAALAALTAALLLALFGSGPPLARIVSRNAAEWRGRCRDP